MRAFDVLRSVGAVGLLIGLTFSCGNDTKSDPDDDDGSGGTTSDAGGTGGTDSDGDGGTGGTTSSSTSSSTTSGAGGMTTAASTSAATTSSTTGEAGAGGLPDPIAGLAEPCESDDDCQSDLICLTAESNSLGEGGPSNGMCTVPCESNAECSTNAACIGFGGDTAYCMPMCLPNDGNHDCGERPDAVCDVLPVEVSCSATTDCPAGLLCMDETQCVLPVCLPKCNRDNDCPEGRFCDPGYGVCVDEEPEGKALNEICDDTLTGDEDECLGFCAGGGDTDARCLETCVLGVYPACGSESTESGTASCLAPYVGLDLGDLGFCVGLCDCNSDCPDEGMECISFASLDFDPPEEHGRAGACAPIPAEGEERTGEPITECP